MFEETLVNQTLLQAALTASQRPQLAWAPVPQRAGAAAAPAPPVPPVSGCGSAFTPNNTTETFQSKALRALDASNRSQLLFATGLSTQVSPSLFLGSVLPFKPPGHSAFLGRYPEFPRVLFATSRRRRPSFSRTM